jgi:all-trans-retinol 13,14-reductase
MNLHGILGVTMSALVTSAELVGMDKLVNDIIEA